MNEQCGSWHIGVFFDGTGNNASNAAASCGGIANGKGSYGNARSNVALLHGLYPSGVVQGRVYFKHYAQGIGTTAGAPDSAFGQATGRGETGVLARVEQALAVIAGQLRDHMAAQAQAMPGRIEFDLFGFSRGAAAARHLANRLGAGEQGLPAELQGERVINFIGLFDSVAAMVAPLRGNFDPANARYAGLRLGLGAKVARQVVQLVAADERRHNFALVRSGNDIVVPGVHSNIGGGYPPCMREQVMLCKPFSNQVPQCTPVERTAAYAAAKALLASTPAADGDRCLRVVTWEEPVAGGRAQRDTPQKTVYAAVLSEREVLGHLSRVYLSIMRELGVRAGVPFLPLGDDEDHRLPPALLGISDKLHDYVLGGAESAALSAEEEALLRARYVHASAHWNALKGMRNSRLDVLFVDRPEEGGRVLHDNPV